MSSAEKIIKHKFVDYKYCILDDKGTAIEQIDIPVSYVHGTDHGMFEKIENALTGHYQGDTVEVEIQPSEAFGEHITELTYTDYLNNVPEEYRQFGAEIDFKNDKGEVRQFRVTKFENGKITFDGNHPLAGKSLNFVIDIVSVRNATDEEIENGRMPVN